MAESGTYWSWTGIKNVLGQYNAIELSQLDNDVTTADMDRVEYDGTIADAYTNRRARMGNNQYTTPIPDTSADFTLIQLATDTYAAYLLARHRVHFGQGTSEDEQSRTILGLRRQAMDLYDELFGPARDGVDGGEIDPNAEPEPGTIVNVTLDRGTNATVVDGDEYAAC